MIRDLPATSAQMNNVMPNIGIIIVLAIKRYLNLETWRYKRGSWMMINKKKVNNWAEVTCADSGIWLGNLANDGHMAVIMEATHCPP